MFLPVTTQSYRCIITENPRLVNHYFYIFSWDKICPQGHRKETVGDGALDVPPEHASIFRTFLQLPLRGRVVVGADPYMQFQSAPNAAEIIDLCK